jgi:hypothetical protein
MTRGEALRTAAAVIARHVPDLPGLALLLADAGQGRLSAALRACGGKKRATPRERGVPDAEVWAAAARRMVGGGR